jgi:hypothetical protein
MSYNPKMDFIGLLRLTGSGIRSERMPGLDYVVDALSRSGMFNISIGQTAPIANQATTAWFQPGVPSWAAEGTLFLWNAGTASYQPATPALWAALLAPIIGGYSFQSVTGAAASVIGGTSLLAIQRNAPVATALTLPALAGQFATGKKLQIVDFSTNVVNHDITITPAADGSTIMRQSNWQLLSNVAQLSGIMLTPSPDLNSWVIAP